MNTLKIVTRKSQLALWQANHVKQLLLQHHTGLSIEVIGVTTEGDRWLDKPLTDIGGKGLFVKELETALLTERADIAVHSMKDVPATLPKGLILGAMLPRANAHDVLVSCEAYNLETLPNNAVVGTSSLRRTCQLKNYRYDLEVRSLRGNINTRLDQLKAGKYTAIVLAACGLERLGITEYHQVALSIDHMLPAVGQGVLGIECRAEDSQILTFLEPLVDISAQQCVLAERAMNAALEGNCQAPIAGYATIEGHELMLRGVVGEPNGTVILSAFGKGAKNEPEALGKQVAQDLIAQGADKIIQALKHDAS